MSGSETDTGIIAARTALYAKANELEGYARREVQVGEDAGNAGHSVVKAVDESLEQAGQQLGNLYVHINAAAEQVVRGTSQVQSDIEAQFAGTVPAAHHAAHVAVEATVARNSSLAELDTHIGAVRAHIAAATAGLSLIEAACSKVLGETGASAATIVSAAGTIRETAANIDQ